jgi:hypothetical protein
MHRIIRIAIFFLFVMLSGPGWAGPHDFSAIDRGVLGMPHENNLQDVIGAVAAMSHDDWERARGAYVWVANNIAYDTDSFFHGTPTETDAEGVFKTGKSVCEGYANLFAKIAGGLGLEVKVIPGFAKAYGYVPGRRFTGTDHTWNAVKLDGEWHFIETTWGSGHVDGTKYIKDYQAVWFDMDPRLFVFNHFPADTNWLLLSPAMSLEDYESAPLLETYNLEKLASAGYTPDSILEMSKYLPFGEYFGQYATAFIKMGGKPIDMISYLAQNAVPTVWEYGNYKIQLVSYPREGNLTSGNAYSFAVRVPGSDRAAVITGKKFFFLQKDGDLFSGEVTVVSGEASLSADIINENKLSYWPIMVWQVK